MKYFKEHACQSCEYFIQHYACLDGRYTPINAGHCIYGRRRKKREAISPSCEHWRAQDEIYQEKHKPPKEHFIRYVILEEK